MSRAGAVLGLALVAAGAAACSGGGGREYRHVLLDGQAVVCAAVFRTAAQHSQGLSGPSAPAAGAFVNDPPARPRLWMHDVPRDLVAVWVGAGGTVLGSVAMRAETTALHPAPAAVPLVLELAPALWQRWSGSTHAALGGRCRP